MGESGCGKNNPVKTIMGILPENAVINRGEVIFNGKDESVSSSAYIRDYGKFQRNKEGDREPFSVSLGIIFNS